MSAEAGASLSKGKDGYLRLLAALFLVASPLIIMLMLSLLSGHNMFLSKPVFNDELDYWRLMYSISCQGFDFGSTEHLVGYVAPIGPLGSHGLSPVAAWLWYVLLFPMSDSALVIAGVIMLSAAFALLCLIWWLLAERFAAYPLLRRKLQQYQHILVPLVLIAIGLSVLLG